MSRIGKKPIPMPKGVTYTVEGSNVTVKGPKGTVTNHLPKGVSLEQKDGEILINRESDQFAAVHGLNLHSNLFRVRWGWLQLL